MAALLANISVSKVFNEQLKNTTLLSISLWQFHWYKVS